MKKSLIAMLCLSVFVLSATVSVFAQTTTLEGNLTTGCVTDYDPTVDYFPAKTTLTDAENFTVSYFNNYKVVTVAEAYDGAPSYDYVLVQCGTPAPDAADFPEGTQFLAVPARTVIAMSTTQLPHLTQLDLLDRLVGVDTGLYINTPEVVALVEAGTLVEIGGGTEVNIELALDTDPDLILSYGYNPDFDAFPVLIDAGIFTSLNADYREATPLSRAEWIKFTALFFNVEATAETVYADIAASYNEAAALAATVPADARPTVLWNSFSSYDTAWSIPGALTYPARLIQDAGGVIALGDQAPDVSVKLTFEAVYAEALDAAVWLPNLFAVSTLADIEAVDSRYVDFAAFATRQVWNDNLSENANGGNNYYELGVTNPDLVLRDLVAIFHPELLPDHAFVFFRRLG